uniref:Uncharacterized protein n=1 Tax=mine drainage metagenome TaxID=410659 RepID=E6QE15_9ZZZZ
MPAHGLASFRPLYLERHVAPIRSVSDGLKKTGSELFVFRPNGKSMDAVLGRFETK